ncbi:MAG: phosphoglucomutase [Gracilibacter sp. BRH_c7a]|nr:MAG: phosphoglucomutase [Gracilibacter sp. BRH_c7a]
MLIEDSVKEKFARWINNDCFDCATKDELLALDDPSEIEDRFYTDLEFGTGGMRGIIGAGTNRMNKYVIRRLTQGLADTIKDHGEEACAKGVVIAHDPRRYSKEFALETALVLAANGIKAYLFDSLRPVPELSFAVRYLHTMAGVNITASHNPKEYNGYKVYWEDGGQIPPNKANIIVSKMSARESWEVEISSETEARSNGFLVTIGEDIDKAYLEQVKAQLLYPELVADKGKMLKIVYSPLHGSGGMLISRILKDTGFSSLFVVPEQKDPDTEFATVKSPNPEDPAAFELALTHAVQQNADIVMASDPDADRLGLYVKGDEGYYHRFNGNQIGVLLQYYILSQRKKRGNLPDNAVVVKTVASTDLGDAVAEKFGVKTVNVLVGFKYIGEQIRDMEEKGWGTYQFGFEESFGYLAGTHARDKDAVVAAALLAEAALYYRQEENKNLTDVLDEIHKMCGYYRDEQVALTYQGKAGKECIANIMNTLRKDKKIEIAGIPLKSREDYYISRRQLIRENREEEIDLPKANVLRFSFAEGGFVMARPSGTEPKIRFYFCVKDDSPQALLETMKRVKEDFMGRIKEFLTIPYEQ